MTPESILASVRFFLSSLGIFLFLMLVWVPSSSADRLSPAMYQQLVKVGNLMEIESWQEAKSLLEELGQRASGDYAKALAAQSLGQIAVHQEDLETALSQFLKAYELDSLPPERNQQLQHSIAQLQCALDQWQVCRDNLAQWISMASDRVKASDHMLLAQAEAMLEHWSAVLESVGRAIALRKRAPLSWYRLLVAAHLNLERWRHATAVQQMIVAYYPQEADAWRRLVAFHMQQQQTAQALAVMRLAYERGMTTSPRDIRLLVQLLYQNSLPFRAAMVLSSAMDSDKLAADTSDLSLLAGLWLEAQELERAAGAYRQLIAVDDQGKWRLRLAKVLMQARDWQTLVDLAASSDTDPELELMRAIALINLKRFDIARTHLEHAGQDESLQTQVKSWLSYLDQLS